MTVINWRINFSKKKMNIYIYKKRVRASFNLTKYLSSSLILICITINILMIDSLKLNLV